MKPIENLEMYIILSSIIAESFLTNKELFVPTKEWQVVQPGKLKQTHVMQ